MWAVKRNESFSVSLNKSIQVLYVFAVWYKLNFNYLFKDFSSQTVIRMTPEEDILKVKEGETNFKIKCDIQPQNYYAAWLFKNEVNILVSLS